jgi:hypothetical protein
VAEPLLILLRRFATESAREEARLYCDELAADDFIDTLNAHVAFEQIDYEDAYQDDTGADDYVATDEYAQADEYAEVDDYAEATGYVERGYRENDYGYDDRLIAA